MDQSDKSDTDTCLLNKLRSEEINKTRMEVVKTKIEIIKGSLYIAFILGISFGAVVLMIYCGSIGYFPSEVSVGDVFLFESVALSFGLVCVSVIIIMQLPSFLIYWKKYLPHPHLLVWTFAVILFLFDLIMIFLVDSPARYVLIFIIAISVSPHILTVLKYKAAIFSKINSLCSLLSRCKQKGRVDENYKSHNPGSHGAITEEPSFKVTFIVLLFGFLIIIFRIENVPQFLEYTMKLIAVRQDAVDVHISDKYVDILKHEGIQPVMVGKDVFYDNANILFQGVGANILIDIHGAKLNIPKSDIIILKKNK